MAAKKSIADHMESRVKPNGQPPPAPEAPPPKKGGTASGAIHLRAVLRTVLSIPIVGTAPLIVHNVSQKMALEFLAGRFGVTKPARVDKDPEAEFNAARYVSTAGWDGMHAGAFRSACIGAARAADSKIPMTVLQRLIFIQADGDSVPLTIPELGLTFSSKPLVRIIGEAKMRTDLIRVDNDSPDVRFRAEYWPWSAILRVEFNSAKISDSDLVSLVNLAGMSDGVGEQRPSAPRNFAGQNGTWKVKGA
jgi:hypothetical protein